MFSKKQIALAIASTFSISSFSLFADDLNDAVERIEVIEHKRAYRGNVPITQLPQSVSVLSDMQLDKLSIVSFDDALDLVASTSRQNNFGGLWESFSIRGFAGDENLPSAYLINGFSAGRGFSGLRDISNIEAIEVVKGPGSALYGRSEPGGTVNIITKKPQFEQQGYFQLTAGKYNFGRAEFDYTGAASDSVALRINGSNEDSESYRDTIDVKKSALNPSLYWQISDETSLSYELEFAQQEIPFDRGIPVIDGLTLPAERFLGEPADGPMEVDALGHQLEVHHSLSGSWDLSVGLGYRESSLEGYSSDTELSPGRQLLYIDGQTLNRQRRYRDYDAEDLSARFELSGSFKALSLKHNLLIGGDVYDYQLESRQSRFRIGWGSGDTTYSVNVFNPVYSQVLPEVAPLVDNLEEQSAWGFYLQDQIDINSQLKILAGLRYDKFEQDITNRRSQNTVSQSQSEVSPRLGLVYHFNEALQFYTSYSEGFRPNSGADYQSQPFEPEKSTSLEAGLKWQLFNGGVNGSFALFKAEKSNILTADPVNSGFSAALGKAESTGAEVEFEFNIGNNTQLIAHYAYVDAHTVNDMTNTDWGVAVPAGSRLINVPKHNVQVTLSHNLSLFGKETEVGANLHHVGKRLGETINPDYQLPSYTLTNLFATIDMSDKLQLLLKVENLFNEEYIQNSYSHLWSMPGSPVSYKASLKYHF